MRSTVTATAMGYALHPQVVALAKAQGVPDAALAAAGLYRGAHAAAYALADAVGSAADYDNVTPERPLTMVAYPVAGGAAWVAALGWADGPQSYNVGVVATEDGMASVYGTPEMLRNAAAALAAAKAPAPYHNVA